MFGFFDPLTIVRIWNLFALQNLRNFPYYVHFSMTPPDADIISGGSLMSGPRSQEKNSKAQSNAIIVEVN